MKEVQCPYFLSRTNGKKLYINCSKKGTMVTAERIEFDDVENRKFHYRVKCQFDFKSCSMYQRLKMKNGDKITAVAEEARKILKDYPHLKYYEAIAKAKEVLKGDMGGKNGSQKTKVH